MENSVNHAKTFGILTLTIFIGLLIPVLVQDGMFLDGVTYSAVARNMYLGLGSFWQPQYTQTIYSEFHEQPPLVFGIQALLFKILGDGIHVERIYTLVTALITGTGIISIWRLFNKENNSGKYAWFPVLLWISVPIIFWSYTNNIIENTLSFLTVFAIYCISKAYIKQSFTWLFPASILIVLAFLSKGPVGLFPLATPFLLGLTMSYPKLMRPVFHTLVLIISSCLLYYALIQFSPGAKENLTTYLDQHVLPALANKREQTVNYHLWILLRLIEELAAPIIVSLLLVFLAYRKKRSLQSTNIRLSYFFLLVGLSASIPLTITLKQRGFYLTPSIPFYILSICTFILPYLKILVQQITDSVQKKIILVSYIALSIIVSYSIFRFGKYSRDEQILKDIYAISKYFPAQTIFYSSPELRENWPLIAYLSRVGNLNLGSEDSLDYVITKRDEPLHNTSEKIYEEVNISLTQYRIYKKTNIGINK